MAAIVAVRQASGNEVGDSLTRMLRVLEHRGTAVVGTWCDGCVGLGYRGGRPAVEKKQWRAMEDSSRNLAIVADARIDNRQQLLRSLDVSRLTDEATDDELLLAAYLRWGRDFPRHVLGDFAFILWDGRTRELVCARDPFGVKPLCYYESGDTFAIATEPKALVELRAFRKQLNEFQVACYIEGILVDRELTFLENVLRLPPAHVLSIGPYGHRLTRYWTANTTDEIRYDDDRDYAAAFRSLFTDAVRSRMPSAGVVGSALSGGLDSSSITCIARELLAERPSGRLPTFSAIFPGLPEEDRKVNDERPFMQAVAAMGGMDPHWIRADEATPFLDLDRVLWHEDGPPLGYNLYMSWLLFQAAGAAGVDVFLDGLDGDSTVNPGYSRFEEMARTGDWAGFDREAIALSRSLGCSPTGFARAYAHPHLVHLARSGDWFGWFRTASEIERRFGTSRRSLMLKTGIRPFIPHALLAMRRRTRRKAQQILEPGFARRIGFEERRRALNGADGVPASSREAHWQSVSGPIHQNSLEMADRAAAAFGVELRYPFFDRRLIEFCLGLPLEQKLSNGWTRVVMRRALEGVLPAEVQWRPGKQDLTPNFVRGIRAERSSVEECVLRNPGRLAEFANMAELRATFRRFMTSTDRAEQRRDGPVLYRAVVLSKWLKQFDGGSTRLNRAIGRDAS